MKGRPVVETRVENRGIQEKKTKRKLVYIMAPSYTGSTLLTFLLASHPRIATIGELKATAMGDIDRYTCSCGELIRKCRFWQEVGNSMQRAGFDFSLQNMGTHFRTAGGICDLLLRTGVRSRFPEVLRHAGIQLAPGCRLRFEEILERNRILIDIVCQIQNSDIFLDASKDPVRVKHFLGENHWEIKLIYLIRDGRAVTNSYMQHHKVSMEKAVREWVKVHGECDIVERMFDPKDCFRLHYEDLCREPDEWLERLYDFMEIEKSINGRLDYRRSEQHILGNMMRLKSTAEIKLDEKWKRSMTEKDLDAFQAVGGKLNQSYGYSKVKG